MSRRLKGLPAGFRARLRALLRRLRGGKLSRSRAASSVAVGLFIGCLPVYGLHFLLCAAVCLPLRLDLLIAYVAANISNPIIAPFLLTAEVETGSLLLTGHVAPFDIERARQTGVAGFFAYALVGSLFIGAALAGLGACVAALLTPGSGARLELQRAIRKTVERYASAPDPDRMYVAIKLRTDPLTRQLASLGWGFGRVLDLGCGRGQFSLFLLELGVAASVAGLDWDARKVAVAEAAAAGHARFELGDLRALPEYETDTILLFDVLHYLEDSAQDRLLETLARRLSPGGRLLIRDVDERGTLRSGMTRLFERIGTRLGYNRAGALHFRSAAELSKKLESLGLACAPCGAGTKWPLANVLIVAERALPQSVSRNSTVTAS